MSDLPPDLQFKLVPDWLKDQPATNPYADFEGERERRPREGREGREGRGGDRPRFPRRDSGGGGRPEGARPSNRGDRGPRHPGDSRDPRSRDRDRNRSRSQDSSRQDRFSRDNRDNREERPPRPPEQPAPVKIEFFPEAHFVEAVLGYIRNTGHAYALFDLARSFLVKQDRHRVKVTVSEPEVVLNQVGEKGAITLDAQLAERSAFQQLQKEFYTEEVLEREPVKGNFSNVARCRLSGEILGPTSHHSYQVALRKHYEQRFSRRMSFPEFLREIETSNKPEDIEAWKESSRRVVIYKTIVKEGEEGEPVQFTDLAQVEAHFRKNHLPNLIRSGNSFEMTGAVSRNLPDRRIGRAVQVAWEKERAFPGQMMYHLREQFLRAGLHFFKHHKRQQFICATRPQLIKEQGLSQNIIKIIRAIEEKPGCTRVDLAHRLFESEQENPELPKLKSVLASDLHWLRQAGHIIEFSDGTIDLPRKKAEEEPAAAGQGQQKKQPKGQQKQPSQPNQPKQEKAEAAAESAPSSAPESSPVEQEAAKVEAKVQEPVAAEAEVPQAEAPAPVEEAPAAPEA